MTVTVRTGVLAALSVFVAAALLAADERRGSERDYVTAWGKPQAGLQGGIRCREQQQTIRGEAVTDFALIVRNVSSERRERFARVR
jgi:hypothetical protein